MSTADPTPPEVAAPPATSPSVAPATRAITAGRSSQGRSLAPPLWASAVWETDGLDDAARKARSARPDGFYARYGNPTVRAFEEAMAELEGTEASVAFASGMGAVASVVLALCSAGDHVVAQRQLYAGTAMLLQGPCARFGIETSFVDATEPGAFAAAVQPGRTMLVIGESPTNPRLDIVDLDELGAIRGPFTMVDATFATPIGQRPAEHGIDLVLHSATKGISGHNDATLGVVSGERELIESIWAYGVLHGATRLRPTPSTRSGACARCPSDSASSQRVRWRSPRRSRATPASPPSTTPGCRRTRTTTGPWPSSTSCPACCRSSSPAAARPRRRCSTPFGSPAAPRRSAVPRRSCATPRPACKPASAPTTSSPSGSRRAWCASQSAWKTQPT